MNIHWFDFLYYGAHILTLLLFIVAFFSNFIPIIPSTLVSWLGILIHRCIVGGDNSVTWNFIGWMFMLFILSQVLDFACTWWGAKKFGATWKGALGALIGGIVGVIFLNIPGIFIGPIVGAFLFEWLNFRTKTEAAKAGLGSLIGTFLAIGFKMGIMTTMIILFYTHLPDYTG